MTDPFPATGVPIALLLATRNAGKAAEAKRIFRAAGGPTLITLEEAGLVESAEEDDLERFDTFEANASAKARHFALRFGLPTVADDSGLEVAALDGRPGVRSKRFANLADYPGLSRSEANNQHLLGLLEDVFGPARQARYVCVAAFFWPSLVRPAYDAFADEAPVLFRGEAPGRVLAAPRGEGGFGYDPVILHERLGRSYAEMTPREKDNRSHRGAAFRALVRFLRDRGREGRARFSRTRFAFP